MFCSVELILRVKSLASLQARNGKGEIWLLIFSPNLNILSLHVIFHMNKGTINTKWGPYVYFTTRKPGSRGVGPSSWMSATPFRPCSPRIWRCSKTDRRLVPGLRLAWVVNPRSTSSLQLAHGYVYLTSPSPKFLFSYNSTCLMGLLIHSVNIYWSLITCEKYARQWGFSSEPESKNPALLGLML